METVDSLTTSPLCPACGYSRVGIAQEARCPECGAAGFADAFVVHGSSVRPGSVVGLIWMVAGLGVGPLIYLGLGPFGLSTVLLMAIALTIGAVRRGSPLRQSRHAAVWLVHPDGVVVRSRGNTRSFPKTMIRRVDCSDSMFGSMSQMILVLHPVSGAAILAAPRILYIVGPKPDRRARWRRTREILGLCTESSAGSPRAGGK